MCVSMCVCVTVGPVLSLLLLQFEIVGMSKVACYDSLLNQRCSP